jgi:hypothetical protein
VSGPNRAVNTTRLFKTLSKDLNPVGAVEKMVAVEIVPTAGASTA